MIRIVSDLKHEVHSFRGDSCVPQPKPLMVTEEKAHSKKSVPNGHMSLSSFPKNVCLFISELPDYKTHCSIKGFSRKS